jgi:hypothetical protein
MSDGYKPTGNRKTDSMIKSVKSGKKKRKKMLENILKGNDKMPRGFQNSAKNPVTGEYESSPGTFDVRDIVAKTNKIVKREKALKKRLKK